MDLKCGSCGGSYVFSIRNTDVFGPIIDTVCPLCGHLTRRNWSAYLKAQTDHLSGNLNRANAMISMAKKMWEVIEPEKEIYKKRKTK